MKLNVKAFGYACSLLWGFGVFFITFWIIAFEGSTGEATLLGKIYRGYNISVFGAFIGLAWGLVDGFLGGVVLAWLYNKINGLILK